MRTNAWIIVERARVLNWREWYLWRRGDEIGPEPALTEWEKAATRRLAHMEYLYKRFLRPTILGKVWIMLSVYDVTSNEISAGYSHLGDAESGGDFGCVGYWAWRAGMTQSAFVALYPWRPAQLLRFMPPTLDGDGNETPASEIRDVNLMLGQPARDFPA